MISRVTASKCLLATGTLLCCSPVFPSCRASDRSSPSLVSLPSRPASALLGDGISEWHIAAVVTLCRRKGRQVLKRIAFPDSLTAIGVLIGATPIGWSFGGLFGTLMAAHVAIIVGFLLEPTKRRFPLAAVMIYIIWWPFWLGQWFWDWQAAELRIGEASMAVACQLAGCRFRASRLLKKERKGSWRRS